MHESRTFTHIDIYTDTWSVRSRKSFYTVYAMWSKLLSISGLIYKTKYGTIKSCEFIFTILNDIFFYALFI